MIEIEKDFKEKYLRDLIAKLFLPKVVPVYRANSQIDVTNTPFYVTLQQTTSTAQGYSIKYNGNTETEYSLVQSNVLFSIQIIGNNAILWANRLQPSFRLTSTVNEFKKLGIGVLQISAIRDLSGAYDSGYEERSQFDLLVSLSTIVKDKLNVINSVEVIQQIEQ